MPALAGGSLVISSTGAVLWVLEANSPARGFYERCGWVADGTRRSHAGAVAARYRVGL